MQIGTDGRGFVIGGVVGVEKGGIYLEGRFRGVGCGFESGKG